MRIGLSPFGCLREEGGDGFAIADDHDGSTGGCVVFVGVVDAHGVIEAGGDVIGREAFMFGHAGGFVAFAEDLTAADSAAGEEHEHIAWVVVAADAFLVDFRSTSEFTGDVDDGGIKQSAGGESGKESGEGFVECGEESGFECGPVIAVGVPATVGDGDEADAGFDESESQQAAGAEGGGSECFGKFGRFFTDIEGFAGLCGGDYCVGLTSEFVHAIEELVVFFDVAEGAVEL